MKITIKKISKSRWQEEYSIDAYVDNSSFSQRIGVVNKEKEGRSWWYRMADHEGQRNMAYGAALQYTAPTILFPKIGGFSSRKAAAEALGEAYKARYSQAPCAFILHCSHDALDKMRGRAVTLLPEENGRWTLRKDNCLDDLLANGAKEYLEFLAKEYRMKIVENDQ